MRCRRGVDADVVPVQEGERDLALRVYAMATRAKVATLRVHTVALGACLLRGDTVDTHASDLATAMTIHRNVQVRTPRLALPTACLCFPLRRALCRAPVCRPLHTCLVPTRVPLGHRFGGLAGVRCWGFQKSPPFVYPHAFHPGVRSRMACAHG